MCVDTHIGKGWSKGLTAASDGRVARAAAAHRGLLYRHDRKPPVDWSPALAYAVGLIATDGCLSGDGRHIAFVSKDEDLMRAFLRCVQKPHLRYRLFQGAFGTWAFRVDMSHAALYRWLLTIGLMPRKSLVLAAIEVPDQYLMHLVRGLLDGDGTVYTLIHHPTRKTYRTYSYERLWTFFNSASRRHVEWIQLRLACALGITGYIERLKREDRKNPLYRLKYGNRESLVLLPSIYADRGVPRLERKWCKWSGYAARHSIKVLATATPP